MRSAIEPIPGVRSVKIDWMKGYGEVIYETTLTTAADIVIAVPQQYPVRLLGDDTYSEPK